MQYITKTHLFSFIEIRHGQTIYVNPYIELIQPYYIGPIDGAVSKQFYTACVNTHFLEMTSNKNCHS